MIGTETNLQRRTRERSSPALEIRFEFVDGSKEILVQTDPELAGIIERQVNGSNLFSHARIVVAETASRTLRDLRIAEVVKQDLKVEQGKVKAYRTRVLLSFKYGS